MTTREAFEAWAKGLGQNLERLPESSPFAGNYKSILMQSRFDAWQAVERKVSSQVMGIFVQEAIFDVRLYLLLLP